MSRSRLRYALRNHRAQAIRQPTVSRAYRISYQPSRDEARLPERVHCQLCKDTVDRWRDRVWAVTQQMLSADETPAACEVCGRPFPQAERQSA